MLVSKWCLEYKRRISTSTEKGRLHLRLGPLITSVRASNTQQAKNPNKLLLAIPRLTNYSNSPVELFWSSWPHARIFFIYTVLLIKSMQFLATLSLISTKDPLIWPLWPNDCLHASLHGPILPNSILSEVQEVQEKRMVVVAINNRPNAKNPWGFQWLGKT